MSPAMIVFGRCVRDFIPVLPGRYKPQQAWVDNAGLRESALRKRHMRIAERLHQNTKQLPPLRVGDHVRIQNQVGKEPLRWDKTGIVVEVRQHDQYVIRVDGSGRVTLRNRKFLRKFQLYEPSIHSPTTVPILNHQITRPTPTRIELPHESPQEAVPPSSDTHPVPQDTPEPLADESIAEPASPPHDIVPEEKSTSAPPTLPIPEVKNIPSPARVIQPESPKPGENLRRSKRKIVPPARYDPAIWDLP